jgi:hypothetical protein
VPPHESCFRTLNELKTRDTIARRWLLDLPLQRDLPYTLMREKGFVGDRCERIKSLSAKAFWNAFHSFVPPTSGNAFPSGVRPARPAAVGSSRVEQPADAGPRQDHFAFARSLIRRG